MVIYNKYWPLLHDASYLLYDHWLGYNSGKQLSFNYEVETRGRLQVKKKLPASIAIELSLNC